MSKALPGDDEYVIASVEGRLDDAKRHVLETVIAAKAEGLGTMISGCAQRLGSVLFRSGDEISSRVLFELSEELDKGSLLAKLDYAKFLIEHVNDRDAALRKCEEIIGEATVRPFEESEDDFSSEQYIEAASRLIREHSLRAD